MNRRFSHSKAIVVAWTTIVWFLSVGPGYGQDVSISGGNLTLTFDTPSAGSDFSDVTDNSSCSLSWNRPAGPGNTKIKVSTNLSSPTATLQVAALNISGGTTTGTVTLSTSAQTLISGLSPGDGGCDLEYTASVSCSDGSATDVHTVTFTITN